MFQAIFEALIKDMGSNLFVKSTHIISEISPLFASCFGIYLIIIALNAYNRGFDDNIVDLTKRIAAWLVIIACAFNASQYLKIANALYDAPEWLAGLINNTPFTYSSFDNNISRVLKMMGDIYAGTKFPPLAFGDALVFTILWFCIFALVVTFLTVVAAFYLVAKVSLAMVILIGPIFIGSMLFPSTRQWGMNWIGQCASYSITVAFYVLLGSIQLDFFENSMMNALQKAVTEEFSLVAFAPLLGLYVLATIVFFVVAISIPSIAAALTGGAGIGSFSTVARSFSNFQRLFGGFRKFGIRN